jgi:hypothetical protein
MNKNDSQIVISKRTLMIGLALILLLIAGSLTLAIGWNTWFGDDAPGVPSNPNGNLDIDPGAGDWNGPQLPDQSGDGAPSVGIKIPGYPSIALPKDKETVNVALVNPEGNPCYFTFELVLKDTGESLYKSKLVPPGKAITKITMARALEAGEYNAIIKINTTSVADGSAMNGANVETVLIVK